MIELDEFLQIADELSAEIPAEIFAGLNGGVRVLPECKISRHARAEDLVTLGEYHHGGAMGCYINLYYGSFMRMYPYVSKVFLTDKVRKTLRHEFRHHLEYRSGIRDLEIEDQLFLQEYLKKNHKETRLSRCENKKPY